MARPALTQDQQARAQRIIRPWLATLLRTAQHLTRNPHEAEDLVQETVIKAMQAIDRYQEGTDARAWLLTILRRTQIDRTRASQRRPLSLSLDGEHAVEPAADDAQVGQVGQPGHHDGQWSDPESMLEAFGDDEVIAALKTLPQEIRWTLLLVDVEQLDHADAAAVLEVPAGTIKSRAHRGRKMLRDRLHVFADDRGWLRTE